MRDLCADGAQFSERVRGMHVTWHMPLNICHMHATHIFVDSWYANAYFKDRQYCPRGNVERPINVRRTPNPRKQEKRTYVRAKFMMVHSSCSKMFGKRLQSDSKGNLKHQRAPSKFQELLTSHKRTTLGDLCAEVEHPGTATSRPWLISKTVPPSRLDVQLILC